MFSVVIATFNRPQFVLRAIGSVLAQWGNHDFEVIIANDGGSRVPVDCRFFESDRVRVINLPENKGLSAARNVAIQKAFGDWICILDDDDWYQPDYFNLLSRERELFKDRWWAYTAFYEWKENSNGILHEVKDCFVDNNCAKDLYRSDFIGMSTLSFSKDAWTVLGGFDETLRCNEDWDWKLKLAKNYAHFSIETPIVNIVTHDEGLYRQSVKSGLAKRTQQIIKERHKDLA